MRIKLGKRGEAAAAGYLRRRGFAILETNYRCRLGEIDIIARDRDTLVFVEVRSRTASSFGTPQETVTYPKQRKLRQVAQVYLMTHPTAAPARFDVVAATFAANGRLDRLEHIPDAF